MVEAVVIGALAGVVAGMLGVGGGVLFVPALVVFLNLSQVAGEATSLLAIVPVALVGAWRQQRYGNFRLNDAVLIGVLAIPGAIGGVALVNAIPSRVVELSFAALQLYVAWTLVQRARRLRESSQQLQ